MLRAILPPLLLADADEARGLDRLRICETEEGCKPAPAEAQGLQGTEAPVLPPAAPGVGLSESITTLPGQADLVCAFNFSTCCLHTRRDLLQYFRGVVERLKQRPATAQPGGGRRPQGGVFAMDLYGGTSSECALKLQRRFGDFEVNASPSEKPGSLHLCPGPASHPSPVPFCCLGAGCLLEAALPLVLAAMHYSTRGSKSVSMP